MVDFQTNNFGPFDIQNDKSKEDTAAILLAEMEARYWSISKIPLNALYLERAETQ